MWRGCRTWGRFSWRKVASLCLRCVGGIHLAWVGPTIGCLNRPPVVASRAAQREAPEDRERGMASRVCVVCVRYLCGIRARKRAVRGLFPAECGNALVDLRNGGMLEVQAAGDASARTGPGARQRGGRPPGAALLPRAPGGHGHGGTNTGPLMHRRKTRGGCFGLRS